MPTLTDTNVTCDRSDHDHASLDEARDCWADAEDQRRRDCPHTAVEEQTTTDPYTGREQALGNFWCPDCEQTLANTAEGWEVID